MTADAIPVLTPLPHPPVPTQLFFFLLLNISRFLPSPYQELLLLIFELAGHARLQTAIDAKLDSTRITDILFKLHA